MEVLTFHISNEESHSLFFYNLTDFCHIIQRQKMTKRKRKRKENCLMIQRRSRHRSKNLTHVLMHFVWKNKTRFEIYQTMRVCLSGRVHLNWNFNSSIRMAGWKQRSRSWNIKDKLHWSSYCHRLVYKSGTQYQQSLLQNCSWTFLLGTYLNTSFSILNRTNSVHSRR